MPLDKPQSALIFNNYIGDTDQESNMNASLESAITDINLFFILADFYYDFSKGVLEQEAKQLKNKFNKIRLEKIVKSSQFGDIETPTVFDKKTGQIISTSKKVFKHFPEFTGEDNQIYKLYDQDFFSIVSDLNKLDIDNFDDRVSESIEEAKNLNNQTNTLKNVILLHKIFIDNEIKDSKTNSLNNKIINMDQSTLAVIDYMFTNDDSEVVVPYVAQKLPSKAQVP